MKNSIKIGNRTFCKSKNESEREQIEVVEENRAVETNGIAGRQSKNVFFRNTSAALQNTDVFFRKWIAS